ncbi:MAG: glycosyl hydrolase family 28-related protein, partial [Verrucomicrobiia bacterium]
MIHIPPCPVTRHSFLVSLFVKTFQGAAAALVLITGPAAAQPTALIYEYAPPPDAGLIDVVRELGAKGDGRTDNTPIFAKFEARSPHHAGTFYFPDGVYVFSDTLYLGNKRKI